MHGTPAVVNEVKTDDKSVQPVIDAIMKIVATSFLSDTNPMFVSKTFDMSTVKPFSVKVDGEKKEIFLPENVTEIITNDFLTRCFVDMCLSNGYTTVMLAKKAIIPEIMKDEQIAFLKGWYTSMKKMPIFAKNLNKFFKEGIMFGISLMLEGKKIDRSLFRQTTVEDVNIHLFGNSWKVKYEAEKSMIDQLKHFSRLVKTPSDNILTWAISAEKVCEKYGLRDPTKNPVLSDSEQSYLRSVYPIVVDFKVDDINSFSSSSDEKGITSLHCIEKYMKHLSYLQKEFKTVKEIVNKEVNDRTSFLFKHPANKKLVKMKKPLKEIIENVKGFREYGNTFNSSLVFSHGAEKLVLIDPKDQKDIENNERSLEAFFELYELSSSRRSELKVQFSSFMRMEV